MDVIEELNLFGKIHIFLFFFFWGGGGVGLVGWDQSGCEQRIEVFVKIQKKKWGGGVWGVGVGGRGSGSGWGVRVDVIEEYKFLGKFTKNKMGGGGREGGSGWWGGVKVDVNKELKFL